MTPVAILYYATGAACAAPFFAAGTYFLARAGIDWWDARHADEPVHEPAHAAVEGDEPADVEPDPTDETAEADTVVLPPVRRAELLPLSVVTRARAVFAEPAGDWWLTSWSPPTSYLRPALIADAMNREVVNP